MASPDRLFLRVPALAAVKSNKFPGFSPEYSPCFLLLFMFHELLLLDTTPFHLDLSRILYLLDKVKVEIVNLESKGRESSVQAERVKVAAIEATQFHAEISQVEEIMQDTLLDPPLLGLHAFLFPGIHPHYFTTSFLDEILFGK